jgi:hypothetical protein
MLQLPSVELPGKLGKEGKRPRFRFTTRQQRIAAYLRRRPRRHRQRSDLATPEGPGRAILSPDPIVSPEVV